MVQVQYGPGYREGVSIHWTGLLDWNTGLDYWTDLLNHKRQFSSIDQPK